MNLTTTQPKEIIDAEICEQYFPMDEFVAQVHSDSFDEWLFECYVGEDAETEGWVQIIIGSTSGCSTIHTCDGQSSFFNTKTHELVETYETHCFRIEDVNILSNPGRTTNIEGSEEFAQIQ